MAIKIVDLGIVIVDQGQKNNPNRIKAMMGDFPALYEDPGNPTLANLPEGIVEEHLLLASFGPDVCYLKIEYVNEGLLAEGYPLKNFVHLCAITRPPVREIWAKNGILHIEVTDPEWFRPDKFAVPTICELPCGRGIGQLFYEHTGKTGPRGEGCWYLVGEQNSTKSQ